MRQELSRVLLKYADNLYLKVKTEEITKFCTSVCLLFYLKQRGWNSWYIPFYSTPQKLFSNMNFMKERSAALKLPYKDIIHVN